MRHHRPVQLEIFYCAIALPPLSSPHAACELVAFAWHVRSYAERSATPTASTQPSDSSISASQQSHAARTRRLSDAAGTKGERCIYGGRTVVRHLIWEMLAEAYVLPLAPDAQQEEIGSRHEVGERLVGDHLRGDRLAERERRW